MVIDGIEQRKNEKQKFHSWHISKFFAPVKNSYYWESKETRIGLIL